MSFLKRIYTTGIFILVAIFMILPVFNVNAGEKDNFSITVETDKESYELEETVEYLIKVKNISSNEAKDVSIIDELPSNIKVINTDGQINGNKISWEKDRLLPEEEVVLHLSIKLNEITVTPPVDVDDDTIPPTEGDIGDGDTPPKDDENQETPHASGSKPDTGHNNFIMLMIGIILSGLGYLLYKVKGKKIGKFFIFFLLSGVTFIVTSNTDINAENVSVSQEYNYSVKINGEMIESKITLSANMVFDEDEKPEIPEEGSDLLDPDNPKWSMDSDNDGLMDAEEEIFGTNPNKADTDGDGLLDKFEIEAGLDPKVIDTDNTGINDGDKDLDEDGLTNFEEQEYGTSPIFEDTDGDGLSDYEEINLYFTNPLVEDSDNDGLPDDKEIMLETDPNNPDTNGNGILDGDEKYFSEITTKEYDKDENVEVSISGEIKGAYIENIAITNMEDGHSFITKDIPGYFAAPFRVGLYEEGASEEVTLTFNVKPEILKARSSNIGLYVYNSELEVLEEVTNTTKSYNGTELSVDIVLEKYKDYVLLIADEWNEAWHKEILDPNTTIKEFDVALTIDSSGSMEWNDPDDIRKSASINFINKLEGNNRAAIVDFDYWATILQPLTTDKELLVAAINEIDSFGGTDISWGLKYAVTALTQNIQLLSLEDDVYQGFEEMKKVLDNGTENLGNTNVLPIESSLKLVTQNDEDRAQYIILLTDGQSYVSPDDQSIKYAKEHGIKVFTVGLGEEVEEDVLRMIASETGGSYLFATSAEDLNGLFDELTDHIIDLVTDSDGDGIPNYFERNLRLENGEILQLDPNNPDTDGDGLSDGFEICGVDGDVDAFFAQYREDIKAFRFNSYPDKIDSDNDNIPDGNGEITNNGSSNNVIDESPRKDDVSDRMLLEGADLSYKVLRVLGEKKVSDVSYTFKEDSGITTKTAKIADWTIVKHNSAGYGFGGIALRLNDQMIISYAGTKGPIDVAEDLTMLLTSCTQNDNAEKFLKDVLKKNPDVKQVYISGHSLGGHLTQYAANSLYNSSDKDKLTKALTFNAAPFTNPKHIIGESGPALMKGSGLTIDYNHSDWEIYDDKNLDNIIYNYAIKNDFLNYLLGGRYLGADVEVFDQGYEPSEMFKAHKLNNFYKRIK